MEIKKNTDVKKPPKQKPVRLNVLLSERDKERVDKLVEIMEADTVTDVTKDAFRLLEYFISKSQKGAKFFIQEPNEELTKIEIFRVTT